MSNPDELEQLAQMRGTSPRGQTTNLQDESQVYDSKSVNTSISEMAQQKEMQMR